MLVCVAAPAPLVDEELFAVFAVAIDVATVAVVVKIDLAHDLGVAGDIRIPFRVGSRRADAGIGAAGAGEHRLAFGAEQRVRNVSLNGATADTEVGVSGGKITIDDGQCQNAVFPRATLRLSAGVALFLGAAARAAVAVAQIAVVALFVV